MQDTVFILEMVQGGIPEARVKGQTAQISGSRMNGRSRTFRFSLLIGLPCSSVVSITSPGGGSSGPLRPHPSKRLADKANRRVIFNIFDMDRMGQVTSADVQAHIRYA